MRKIFGITSLLLFFIIFTSFVFGQTTTETPAPTSDTPALDALKAAEVPNFDAGSFPGWGWFLIGLALGISGIALALAIAARRPAPPAPEEEVEPEPAPEEAEIEPEEEEEPEPEEEEEPVAPPAGGPGPGPAGGAAALIIAGLTSLFFFANTVFAGPKTDFVEKLKNATVEAGTMAKTAKASADAADQKATGASQEAQLAKTLANGASQDATEAKKIAEAALAEAKKRNGGGTTTVVRNSSGAGHDVTARMANWRLVIALFLASGDDLATAKAKATKFVKDPKGSEDELWKAAATVREKVRETGPDLSTYATKAYVDKGDSDVETIIARTDFINHPELNTQLDTKADKAEVEGLLADVQNISEKLSAKADKAEVDKVKEIIFSLREETGMTFFQIASALAGLSEKEDAGKVENRFAGSSIKSFLGFDRKVTPNPDAEDARRKAAATARAIAAKYAEFK